MDSRLAVTDEDPQNPGVSNVKFWVDEVPSRLVVAQEAVGATLKKSLLLYSEDTSPRVIEMLPKTVDTSPRAIVHHQRGSQTILEPHQKIRSLEGAPCIRWNR